MVTATIIPDRVMDGMSVGRWLSFGVCLCVLGRVESSFEYTFVCNFSGRLRPSSARSAFALCGSNGGRAVGDDTTYGPEAMGKDRRQRRCKRHSIDLSSQRPDQPEFPGSDFLAHVVSDLIPG